MGLVYFALVVTTGFYSWWKAVMDISSEDLFPNSWWNKNQSWENKYNMVPKPHILDSWVRKLWLRFLAWSFRTWLVAFTDGWHLSQWLMGINLLLVMILNTMLSYIESLYAAIAFYIISKILFQIFYSILKLQYGRKR